MAKTPGGMDKQPSRHIKELVKDFLSIWSKLDRFEKKRVRDQLGISRAQIKNWKDGVSNPSVGAGVADRIWRYVKNNS